MQYSVTIAAALATTEPIRYVCVHNRNRDNYEVPLALAEAGLLEVFVTDFYANRRWHKLLPRFLARRCRDGLPADQTVTSLTSFLIQYVAEALHLPMHRIFPLTDYLLGKKAVRVARRRNVSLFAYSSYLNDNPGLPAGRPVIDFEYHPHPALAMQILRADHKLHPQVAWSFEREQAAAGREQINRAWRHGDAVVCASSMTRRSLEHAGCPADRITVIPYGAAPGAVPALPRQPGRCRFLFVGQGIQRKGLHHLALAWAKAALPDAELTIVTYRIDPGIANMLVLPNVTILSHQPRAALDRLFSAADVFVMPSLVEGFGLVYQEALQAGCHVIGTENTGLPDLDLSRDACTIVPPGDVEALVQAIERLAAKKSAGQIDPLAIQAQAANWSWPDFRCALAKLAADVSLAMSLTGAR